MSLPTHRRPARHAAFALLALLLASAALQAQGVSPGSGPGTVGGGPQGPSVFEPSGGGQYQPPGDAGGPSGGPGGGGGDDNDGDGGSGKPGTGAVAPPGRLRPSAPASTPVPEPAGRGGAAGGSLGADSPLSVGFDADRWDLWWETNKFDFIELRRVEDAPVTPQGGRSETSAERELRLATVRAHVREAVLPAVRELLQSDDSAVRGAAAVALGKLRDAEGVDLIRGLLSDGSLEVRRSAMLALGVMDNGRSAWMLLHVAADSPTGRRLLRTDSIPLDERGTALLAATLRGDAAAEQLLVELLSDRRGTATPLLALAADAAGLLGSTAPLRPLIDIAFDRDLPEHVRSAATSALGRIGDPSVTPALVELLDAGLEPQRAAVLALGLVAHPGAGRVVEKLAALLEHGRDAPARHFAAVSLGRIGGPEARTRLLSALGRAETDLRPWVALGLGLCERREPGADVVPALLQRLGRESSSDARGALIVALGLTRSEAAVPVLVEQLSGSSAELAGHAALALGLTQQAAATRPLRDALARSTDPRVLRQAALGLGILGDTASIPDLLELIRTTGNPFVASFAAIGTAFMGDAEAAGPLLDMIRREGPSGVTTTWAVAAVGQLFDLDRRPALSRLAAGDNYHVRPAAVSSLLNLGY